MLGRCLRDAWDLSAGCLEDAWDISEGCLKYDWEMLGRCSGDARDMLGRCMGDAWEMVLDGSGSAKANASAYPSAWRNPPRRKDPRPESRAPPSIHSFDVAGGGSQEAEGRGGWEGETPIGGRQCRHLPATLGKTPQSHLIKAAEIGGNDRTPSLPPSFPHPLFLLLLPRPEVGGNPIRTGTEPTPSRSIELDPMGNDRCKTRADDSNQKY